MDSVNKKELALRAAARAGVAPNIAYAVISASIEEIRAAVANDERVGLSRFGTFEPRNRAARKARNPRTGETVPVEACKVPVFRPAQEFRDRVDAENNVVDQ